MYINTYTCIYKGRISTYTSIYLFSYLWQPFAIWQPFENKTQATKNINVLRSPTTGACLLVFAFAWFMGCCSPDIITQTDLQRGTFGGKLPFYLLLLWKLSSNRQQIKQAPARLLTYIYIYITYNPYNLTWSLHNIQSRLLFNRIDYYCRILLLLLLFIS